MTVSLALRQDPRIPAATQTRVQKIAERIGYRKNPLVAVLMSNLRGLHPRDQDAHVIAYVESVASNADVQSLATLERFRNGAKKAAKLAGYQIESFGLGEEGVSEERLLQILKARGIRGVVFAPFFEPHKILMQSWERHAMASIGYSLKRPQLHRSINHHAHSIRLAAQRLTELGYRRIGLALNHNENERTEHAWLSAFLLLRHQRGVKGRGLPLLLGELEKKRIHAWLDRESPDCVLSSDSALHLLLRDFQLKRGKPVGFASLHMNASNPECSGIDQNNERVGGAALELVIEQLHGNNYGVPTDPKTVLVEGCWRNGSTTPGVASPAAADLSRPA